MIDTRQSSEGALSEEDITRSCVFAFRRPLTVEWTAGQQVSCVSGHTSPGATGTRPGPQVSGPPTGKTWWSYSQVGGPHIDTLQVKTNAAMRAGVFSWLPVRVKTRASRRSPSHYSADTSQGSIGQHPGSDDTRDSTCSSVPVLIPSGQHPIEASNS